MAYSGKVGPLARLLPYFPAVAQFGSRTADTVRAFGNYIPIDAFLSKKVHLRSLYYISTLNWGVIPYRTQIIFCGN
jgi:hypothetical protein